MNSGRYILSQILDLVHRQTLDRLVEWGIPLAPHVTNLPNGCIKDAPDRGNGLPDDLG